MKKTLSLFVALTILVGGSISGFQNTAQATIKATTTTKKPVPTKKPTKPVKPIKPAVKPTAKPAKPTPKPVKPTPKPTPKPAKPTPKPTPSPTPSNEVSGSLSDIANKLNAAIPESERVKTANVALSKDNIEYMLGTKDITYTEGLASEAMINAIAHSMVLIRVPSGTDIQATMDKIKKSVNPRKWICVGVEDKNVQVVNKGNLIMLIMSENSDKYVDAFSKLKK